MLMLIYRTGRKHRVLSLIGCIGFHARNQTDDNNMCGWLAVKSQPGSSRPIPMEPLAGFVVRDRSRLKSNAKSNRWGTLVSGVKAEVDIEWRQLIRLICRDELHVGNGGVGGEVIGLGLVSKAVFDIILLNPSSKHWSHTWGSPNSPISICYPSNGQYFMGGGKVVRGPCMWKAILRADRAVEYKHGNDLIVDTYCYCPPLTTDGNAKYSVTITAPDTACLRDIAHIGVRVKCKDVCSTARGGGHYPSRAPHRSTALLIA